MVFDVHSQVLHEVDELAWELLRSGLNTYAEAVEKLGSRFGTADIAGALGEITALRARGLLYAPDPHADYDPPPPLVKALCLNVAHHCNLACRYCFAAAPEAAAKLMPKATARRAVDYLLAASGARRHVEIDFFGGEPLLNFPVIRDTVEYARRRGKAVGKEVGFTVTTNGLLLTPEIIRFLLNNRVNVVLSLDGRPEVHDRLRHTVRGQGSHAASLTRIRQFVSAWRQWDGPRGYYYLRGTFTRHNLDFADDFCYLVDQGFDKISLEPVVSLPCTDYGLREEDLAEIRYEYQRLADIYLELARQNAGLRFFHFQIDLDEGPCLPKRLAGCGAGHAYLAVDAEGDLYPCHQFIGREEFLMGNVFTAELRYDLVEHFRHAHVYTKEGCVRCWAKFLCSGGCHAHAYLENRSVLKPSRLGCALMRARLEAALYVQAAKNTPTAR